MAQDPVVFSLQNDGSGNWFCIAQVAPSTNTVTGGTRLITSPMDTNMGAGTPIVITAATAAAPIVCTTATHGFTTGDYVTITLTAGSTTTGLTGLLGTFRITVVSSTTFSLDNSSGSGTFTASSAYAGKVQKSTNPYNCMNAAVNAFKDWKAAGN